MPNEKTKDVEVGGKRYRVGRFNPRDGSWVAFLLMTKALPAWIGDSLVSDMGLPVGAGQKPELSEADFKNLQDHCLRLCFEYTSTEAPPIPVLMADGRFSDPEMDVSTALALTTHAMMFNLSSLFQGGAVKMASAPAVASR